MAALPVPVSRTQPTARRPSTATLYDTFAHYADGADPALLRFVLENAQLFRSLGLAGPMEGRHGK